MAIISVRKLDTYEQGAVDAVVAAHFEALQVERDIRPGMTVLLKPNLLAARRPEQAVTTHPALLRAVAQWFLARGVGRVVIADSPGGPFVAASLNAVYRTCGLLPLSDIATLNSDVGHSDVPAKPGSTHERFPVIDAVLKADYIVNMPKMKTHGMTTVSLGVKNMFGVVPGLTKPRMHYENPGMEGFSNMLVCLAQTVCPQLTLMDAVVGMEGNGPSGGTARQAGLTLASRNVFALDAFACAWMGIEPGQVGMIRRARELCLYDPEDLELVGDTVPPANPPFRMPDTRRLDFLGHVPAFIRAPMSKLMERWVRPVPMVVAACCIGCGKCKESCPQGIIEISEGKAVIRLRGCISCFCCQEMCPVKAIEAEKKLRIR